MNGRFSKQKFSKHEEYPPSVTIIDLVQAVRRVEKKKMKQEVPYPKQYTTLLL